MKHIHIITAAVILASCNSSDSSKKAETAAAKDTTVVSIVSNPMKEAYFGETHIHTAYSLDAYIGGARLRPEDAYRFA
ncbi:MAG: DUF3604 domain-containing protein, partial [Sphingobacteriales bacterium]